METIKWLPGHNYRIRIICSIPQTQKLVLHKGSGVEQTIHDVFLEGRCPDFSKIIFTKDDGETPFTDYWFEVVDDESAVVWVKAEDGRPIFIYPCGPAAAPAPDAPAVQNQVPPA